MGETGRKLSKTGRLSAVRWNNFDTHRRQRRKQRHKPPLRSLRFLLLITSEHYLLRHRRTQWSATRAGRRGRLCFTLGETAGSRPFYSDRNAGASSGYESGLGEMPAVVPANRVLRRNSG